MYDKTEYKMSLRNLVRRRNHCTEIIIRLLLANQFCAEMRKNDITDIGRHNIPTVEEEIKKALVPISRRAALVTTASCRYKEKRS